MMHEIGIKVLRKILSGLCLANSLLIHYNTVSGDFMTVADIMQKNVDVVSPTSKVRDVSRIIFGNNINGVPVCEGKKIVGIVTERDILSLFLPAEKKLNSIAKNSKEFEDTVNKMLDMPIKKIMNSAPTIIKADMPLLEAHSLMDKKDIGRLPVIDNKGELIGIVSKGDIFRFFVGKRLSLGEEEEFYDWFAKHYDLFIDWDKRLPKEIDALTKLFKKENIETVLDVASSTGEHVMALAQKGFESFGLETSQLMHEIAVKKRQELPKKLQDKVTLFRGNYQDIVQELPEYVDAAIFMGNALPHVTISDKNILQDMALNVSRTNGILIFQMANFNKMLKDEAGLKEFMVRQASSVHKEDHAILSFYSQNNKGKNSLDYNVVILDAINNRWRIHAVNSTPIQFVTPKSIKKNLATYGFRHVEFHRGSMYNGLFLGEFDEESDDWYTVVARH